MKNIFKKNQMIIAALAVMIAAAGYLNYSGRLFGDKDDAQKMSAELANQELLDISEEDLASADGEIKSQDSETEGEEGQEGTPGEAVLTSGEANAVVAQAKMTREQVHSLFCMVLQDTWLFEGTIRENIVYNKENVTVEMLKQACKAVGLHHFIRTLPKGYDTVINDKISLSAGQRQQITIARAMIDNAPMLILDEATSSIDTRTEALIQNAMDKLMQGRTSFVIAHRLSTIKNADIILVLKDGDIIESGSHTELMEKGGFYAELYNSQFEVA